jgi:hypothetical protein
MGQLTDALEKGGLLPIALSAAVPLWVLRLQREPWTDIQKRLPALSQHLAEKGDVILFRSEKPGETAAAFNAMAEAIAALSFVPDGVTTFGQHYESHHPDLEISQ